MATSSLSMDRDNHILPGSFIRAITLEPLDEFGNAIDLSGASGTSQIRTSAGELIADASVSVVLSGTDWIAVVKVIDTSGEAWVAQKEAKWNLVILSNGSKYVLPNVKLDITQGTTVV